MVRLPLRFDPWIAAIAGLLSLLGSLLAPAVVRLQAYPGLFPGPAAPGFGLPFAQPLYPLLGALFCGAIAGFLPSGRPPRLLPAAAGSSVCLVWGMLWGGGLTEHGILTAVTVGLLAAGYVAPLHQPVDGNASAEASPQVIRWAAMVPHLLSLLFVALQTGFASPFRWILTLGLIHGILLARDEEIALARPFVACLFLAQSVILVLGTTLWPLLPGW